MAVAWVQSKTVASGSFANATFTSATTTGNLIVVAMSSNATATGSEACSDNQGNTYTKLTGINSVQGGAYAAWYAWNITGGATHTVTVSCPSGGNATSVVVQEFSGVQASADPLDQVSTKATGSSSTPTSNSITTTVANEMVIGLFFGTTTTSAGTGYTNLLESSSTNANRTAMESQAALSTGTYTATVSSSATAWDMYVLSFKAPAGGTIISLADTGSADDELADPGIVSLLPDTGAGVEDVTIAATVPVADTGGGADALLVAKPAALPDDPGSGADALTVHATIPVADTAAATDALIVGQTKSLADTGTATETIHGGTRTPVADTGTGADAVTVHATVPLADTVTAVDVDHILTPLFHLVDTAVLADSGIRAAVLANDGTRDASLLSDGTGDAVLTEAAVTATLI